MPVSHPKMKPHWEAGNRCHTAIRASKRAEPRKEYVGLDCRPRNHAPKEENLRVPHGIANALVLDLLEVDKTLHVL